VTVSVYLLEVQRAAFPKRKSADHNMQSATKSSTRRWYSENITCEPEQTSTNAIDLLSDYKCMFGYYLTEVCVAFSSMHTIDTKQITMPLGKDKLGRTRVVFDSVPCVG
jgi:hypothetical protein